MAEITIKITHTDRITCREVLERVKAALPGLKVALELADFGSNAQPTESEMCEMVAKRDKWEDRATRLAQAVGERFGVDVGEWSSANDPICNALEILDSPSLDDILGVCRKSVAAKLITLEGQMDGVAGDMEAIAYGDAVDHAPYESSEEWAILSRAIELHGAADMARGWAFCLGGEVDR